MKRMVVIAVVLVFAVTGCANGLLGGAKIAVKNQETTNVKLVDAIKELNEQYGEPTPHYRAYKNAKGEAHVIKDLYYTSADGRTVVIVTVIDDDVKQIVTTRR